MTTLWWPLRTKIHNYISALTMTCRNGERKRMNDEEEDEEEEAMVKGASLAGHTVP